MTKTIISIISTVSLLCVGSSGLAEYRNYRGETVNQQFERMRQEQRIRRIEMQQQNDRRQRALDGGIY